MAPVAADEAASAADEAAEVAAEADVSAAEAATEADEAAEAASGVDVAVLSVLVQAARAATATREANRSDLFMNFLEEKFWVRTITGNPDIRPHGRYPSKDSRPSSSISCA